MKQMVLILLLILSLSSSALAVNWSADASCLFVYTYEVDGDPTADACSNSSGAYLATPTHTTTTPPTVGDGFDGLSTGYFAFDSGDGFVGSDQTVEGDLTGLSWINLDNVASDEAAIITKFNSDDVAHRAFLLRVEQNRTLAIYTYGTSQLTTRSTTLVSLGEWEHVAFAYESATPTVSLYINGVEVDYSNTAVGAIQNTTTSITVGRWESLDDEMEGKVDETGLFSSTFDATDINDAMVDGLVQVTTPDVAQSSFQFFDDGAGLPTPAVDASPVINGTDTTSDFDNATSSTVTVLIPAYSDGDLVIVSLNLWSNGSVQTATFPTAPGGESFVDIVNSYGSGTVHVPYIVIAYFIATGDDAGGNINITASADTRWAGSVALHPAETFDTSTPIGTQRGFDNAASGGSADYAEFTASNDDTNGVVFAAVAVDQDPISATQPTGWTLLENLDGGRSSFTLSTRDALVTSSEVVAVSGGWTFTDDAWAVYAFIVRPAVVAATGRTPLAVSGTDPTLEVDTDYGVDIRIENSGVAAGTSFKWQYNLNSGGWNDITGSTLIFYNLTADFANGDDVPEFIGGNETYVADNNAALESSATVALTSTLKIFRSFESHLNFQIDAADVVDDDIIQLRIIYGDDSVLEVYTDIPLITVNEVVSGRTRRLIF